MSLNKIRLITLLSLIILWTGCMEYEEKLNIKKDGSGTITMTYGLPLEMVKQDDSFTAEKIRNDLTGIDGITVISSKETVIDEVKWVEATARFQSLGSLDNIKSDKLPGFSGVMDFIDHGNGSFTFTKVLGELPKTDKPQKTQDMAMMKSMVGDVTWDYEISFPINIVSAESGQGEISVGGKKLTWSVSLAEFIGGQTTLTVILGNEGKMKPEFDLQTLFLKNGKTISGNIVSMTKNSCIVRVDGKRERIDRKEIQSIKF